MSGICGILFADKRPVESALIQAMVNILTYRGRGGQHMWQGGAIALGHTMLHTTPESLSERLPFTSPDGQLIITADARIDNRDELLHLLDMRDTTIPDSGIILAAYRKWNTDCPKYLIGDFAFAIWDASKEALFCARDHLGVKPFYYFKHGKVFAFSSDIKALRALPFVPSDFSEPYIADFLLHDFTDREVTFYQHIRRLPPAHFLCVGDRNAEPKRYWSLHSVPELRLPSDEAYADQFRKIFTEAIRCRLRSAFPVGSFLSGGLDSSSVTCVARNLFVQVDNHDLSTYSAIFPSFPESDESNFIQMVIAQGHIQPHFFAAGNTTIFPDRDIVNWHMEQPYPAPNLFQTWELCKMAQGDGIRVLLTGLDGDVVVSHGFGYFAELALQQRWIEFDANVEPILRYWNSPRGDRFLYRTYAFPQLLTQARRLRLDHVWQLLGYLGKTRDISRLRLLREYLVNPVRNQFSEAALWKAFKDSQLEGLRNLLTEDFEAKMRPHLLKRYRDEIALQPIISARDEHIKNLEYLGQATLALEMIDKAATTFGIEARHPFFDKRLVEFCVSLPGDQKLRNGLGRYVLRSAMKGILPPEIQQRTGKADLGTSFTQRLLKDDFNAEEWQKQDNIRAFVNPQIFSRIHSDTKSIADKTDIYTLWRLQTLAIFLSPIATGTNH